VIARHGDTRLLLVPSALSVCHFRGMLFSNRVRSARRRRREKTCPKADEPAAGKDTHSPSSRASMWRVECRMPQTLLLWSAYSQQSLPRQSDAQDNAIVPNA
jgi:hypothetical protein